MIPNITALGQHTDNTRLDTHLTISTERECTRERERERGNRKLYGKCNVTGLTRCALDDDLNVVSVT